MEDRYLFKAKRHNGEWVIGYLYRLSESNPPFIMLINRVEVIGNVFDNPELLESEEK